MAQDPRIDLQAVGSEVHMIVTDSDPINKQAKVIFSATGDALRVEGTSGAINQDLTSDSSPTFVDLTVSTVSSGTIKYLEVTKTITAAQIRALHSTPISLIAAPGTGKVLQIHDGVIFLDYGTVTFDDAAALGNLKIRTTTSQTVQSRTIEADGLIDATADKLLAIHILQDCVLNPNEAIEIYNDGEAFTGASADSVLKIYLNYTIVTL